MSIQLPITGHYTAKDQLKADFCSKFIGRGSVRSSTNKYREAYGANANCGQYTETDMVFVSVEGNRRGRLPLDHAEVLLAIKANATFVADTEANRMRPYNIGERELAELLEANGYTAIDYIEGACWTNDHPNN